MTGAEIGWMVVLLTTPIWWAMIGDFLDPQPGSRAMFLRHLVMEVVPVGPQH